MTTLTQDQITDLNNITHSFLEFLQTHNLAGLAIITHPSGAPTKMCGTGRRELLLDMTRCLRKEVIQSDPYEEENT